MHIEDLVFSPSNFGGTDEPQQQVAIAGEIDGGRIQHGVWACGPGELNLHFAWHETVYILDGRAEVMNLDSGECFLLTAGSLMHFQRNSRWRWRIPWKLKKAFTIVETE